jgi:hypothetical protein
MNKRYIGALMLVGVGAVALVALNAQNSGSKVTPLTALDYAEIQQLNAAYAHFIDTGEDNGYAWAKLFTQDGVFIRQARDKYEGREKIAELARVTGRGPDYVSHFVTNIMVEATPQGATGRATCIVVRFPDNKMSDQDPRASVPGAGCRYHDDYVRTKEGWRFKSRTVTVSASAKP